MPWRCCVPGCKGYDEAKSMGVVFHGLPTRDPQRCRTWLKAIRNPRFDEDTPVSRYGGVRVCSLHFTPDDYEQDFRAKILNVAPKPVLKSGAVPSVFPGREHGEPAGNEASPPDPKRTRTETSVGAAGSSSQSPPAVDESFCIVVSVDPRDHEFNTTTSSDEDADEDCAVVYSRSLMELFRRCQTCGQPITDKQLLHSGAQVRVKWSCHGGHAGVWKSSPRLRDILP
ncbi:uncharacterized protein LOC116399852 [Anarrhichthys ocellatus]|uniref:uncharacterized protein LOC116399852 n=1 Tax=Anarrhichthys ocellatus TaxID=433405 RepID=UPI0012ED1041|nr:uncharacterized protein LOC116399852 [Anarrhichthys ocellatus]